MQLALALTMATLSLAGDPPAHRPPLMKPALLNIGYVCRWQQRCMKRQEQAMGRSVKYVKKYRPPAWKIRLCNRNASRTRSRVDWIGFNNCIRNPLLRPIARKRRR